MSEAREEILARVRAALRDVPPHERPGDVAVARTYRARGELTGEALVGRFTDRLRDYHADVELVTRAGVARTVGEACRAVGLHRVAVPRGLPDRWRPAGIELVDDAALTAHELDEINGAVTGCAAAIAETGTLVLDGQGASGRRLTTLVPDHHICIVAAEQIVELVPQAIAAVAPAVRERRLPVTLVSGPSASSDIELSRVEGVHGPRHLLVIVEVP